ncbi:MAG: slipin family protein [Elusimicrobia bacterium]|nr:slipin family protein [Elusimicrobiota bacterium]
MFIGLIISIVIVGSLIRMLFFEKITIFEYERGVRYLKGRFYKLLEPGVYWLFTYNSKVVKIDIRPRVVTLPGQEILSSDNITLKITLLAQYEIADPVITLNKVKDFEETAYAFIQIVLREIVGSVKVDEFLQDRRGYSKKLFEETEPKVKEIGLRLLSVDIKDIMFPGELKKVFAQVIQAQKEGLAVLEKARGESAALRHLANVSKIIEDNPGLMQLRVLQSSGNTIVMGVPTETISSTGRKNEQQKPTQ